MKEYFFSHLKVSVIEFLKSQITLNLPFKNRLMKFTFQKCEPNKEEEKKEPD